jgi:methylmalonyl-CoA mutase cobalamin-binding domain/chain
MNELKAGDAQIIPVIVGGIIPPQDEDELMAMGVRKVFRGSLIKEVIDYINNEPEQL